jgi:very-short-patch-repair endonuclease
MSTDIIALLCDGGHVATTAQLQRHFTVRQLKRACEGGLIRRLARGIYACTHIDTPLVLAAQAGGRLDCVSSLARHDVWSGLERPGLHLRMQPHQHSRRSIPGAFVHWGGAVHRADLLEVAPVDAILQAIRCLGPDDALACVESALHTKFLTEAQLDLVLLHAPARLHPMLSRIDRGAQSGYETWARLKLIRAGFRVRTQGYVLGAGPVDIIVEECVGLEVDGEKWHGPERFLHDRTKDRNAELQGVRMLRIGGFHVFDDWDQTLAAIQRMVTDAQRGLRPRRGRGYGS